MSLCSCKLKSGDRKGQQCKAKVKAGQFCGRHTNCSDILPKQPSQGRQLAQKLEKIRLQDQKLSSIVIVKIKYQRTSDDAEDEKDKDPSAKVLESYVSKSKAIPENISDVENYEDFKITSAVNYIGNCKFSFEVSSDLPPRELADLFLLQNLSDTVYGSRPGNGSFVYPTKGGNELGVLSYESVVVDGKKYV